MDGYVCTYKMLLRGNGGLLDHGRVHRPRLPPPLPAIFRWDFLTFSLSSSLFPEYI